MRATRLLFLRQVRNHPLRSLIAVVSVAAGVSMALSIVVVIGSMNRSIEAQASFLAGPAPLRVVGPVPQGGMDESVLDEVMATEGVGGAIPMIQAITLLDAVPADDGAASADRLDNGPDVVVLGVHCDTAALFGQACDDRRVLAIGPALAALATNSPDGASPRLRSATGLDLDEASVEPLLDQFASGMVAVVPLDVAQQEYHRPGSVDVVYVLVDDGTSVAEVKDRLQERVGEHRAVLEATEPPPAFQVLVATLVPLFGILAIFALGVGLVLVTNTVALSLAERRKEMAVVAAIGATDRGLISGALVHAAVLGVAGGLLGSLAALGLAVPLTGALSEFTQSLSGMTVDLYPSTTPYLLAIVAGTLVSVGASWRPARRALRIDIAAEISGRDRRDEASAERVAIRAMAFITLGILGIAGSYLGSRNGALDAWQFPVALLSLFAAMVGFVMAIGSIVPLLGRAVSSVPGPMPGWLRLGASNLIREPGRTGVMAVAIGAAVGTAFVAASFNQSAEAGITEGVTSGMDGRVQLAAGRIANSASVDTFFTPDVLERVAGLAEVADVERGAALIVGTDGFTGLSNWETRGADPDATLSDDFDVYRGTAKVGPFEDGEVLIGAALARNEGLGAGDVLRLPARDGMVELTVQGVWSNGDFNGGAVSLPLSQIEELYGPQAPRGLNILPADGVDTDELAQILEAEFAGEPAVAYTPDELAASIADSVGEQLAPFWIVQRGLTFVAFVAVLTTMLLTAIQRRRELGVLAAIGMEPAAMRRMVMAEAATMSILAVAVAAVTSVGMYAAFREFTPVLLGWKNPMVLAWWTIPFYGAITLVVAVAGAALPAWRMSRTNIVEALSYE